MAVHADYLEEECTMNFLMGLNESFASVRGQIMLLKHLSSLTNVFSLITQKEKQRKIGFSSIVIEFALCSLKVPIPTERMLMLIGPVERKKSMFCS